MVFHWHVIESDAGYLPESQPYVTTDGEQALDALAHLLKDYADSIENPLDEDAAYADARHEHLCTCRQGERSAEHRDALARVESRQGISEDVDSRVFEMNPCTDRDCLKYCPDRECGTAVPITDTDHKCWTCGAAYVAHDACAWLE